MKGIDYSSKKWRDKRLRILKRDKYLCQDSLRYGIKVDADTVHHIFPVNEYPELKFANFNLISLTNKRHNEMHDRSSGKLTKKGLRLLKKKIPDYLKWCEINKVKPHFDY